jgi:murein DD-endopeptidase MepM/ murein hydrolase activator NlpD
MNKNILILIILIIAGLLVGRILLVKKPATSSSSQSVNKPSPISVSPLPTTTPSHSVTDKTPAAHVSNLAIPISNALSRVTKKTFGLYVSSGHSPVSPERFTGYHTGADFETTADEANIDVPIFAICDGKLLIKKYATGYGGVAVQSCTIDSSPVTIIYGHLRLSSIIPNAGDNLKAGDKLGVLGTGYTSETSGERKHLHLGIHKGSAVNILGYVQKQSDLSQWIDPLSILR